MISFGLVLTVFGLFVWVTLIYGVPLLILGLFILFNKKEDEVERRKDRK